MVGNHSDDCTCDMCKNFNIQRQSDRIKELEVFVDMMREFSTNGYYATDDEAYNYSVGKALELLTQQPKEQ